MDKNKDILTTTALPEDKRFFNKFFKNESAGGIVLFTFTIIALIIANVPALAGIQRIWDVEAGISFGSFSLRMTLLEWVNDGLMAVFFFVVGMEIKREMMVGQLSSAKKAMLPVFAALGGMIFPALIYTIFNFGNADTACGWGIPMATDIAFAIGIMSILGNRVPAGIKILLTALAIADDLGSIIVLALFYPTHELNFVAMAIALVVFILLMICNRTGVRRVSVYVVGGLILWYFVLNSGVHATIAGVLLAVAIPHKTKFNAKKLSEELRSDLGELNKENGLEEDVFNNKNQQYIIHRMSEKLDDAEPLMHKCETKLQGVVNFLIMPLFALANAGVLFDSSFLVGGISPVALGIFFGLLFGKPIGIYLFSLLAVKSGLSDLPEGVNFKQVFAMGILGGIGFTMSIFIDNLAFSDPTLLAVGKMSILITSFTAAICGFVILSIMTKHKNN